MRVSVLMFLSLVASSSAATWVNAQPAPRPPVAAAPIGTIDSDVRRDVVKQLSEALRDDYVIPDVGQKAADKINASLAAGEYDRLFDTNSFAARLSSDLASIAHDKHLRVSSRSARPPPPVAGAAGTPRSEAGIVRADRLAGSVGYIEVVGFPPLPAFKPTVDKAMLALKGSRALIIDDRRNGGGSPDAVAYLVSFLVPPKQTVEITDILSRVPKTNTFTRERNSSQPTPVSFTKIPVYVLTSKSTFSGGEEFAYAVQTHRLGKVIGEVTGGGAHPTQPVELGHGFVAAIPFARSEDPITKTDWEGSGVQPDIAVPAQDALKTALTRLGRKPATEIAAVSLKQVFAPRSTPLPGSEAAARQFIAGIVSGKLDYGSMTPEFADFNREHLPMLRQELLQPLGELRSIKFEDVGMMGGDEYRAAFANGALLVDIMLDPEGKVQGAMMRPEPASH